MIFLVLKKDILFFFINAAKLGHISFNLIIVILQNIKAQILLIEKAQRGKTYCVFQKHANSEVKK